MLVIVDEVDEDAKSVFTLFTFLQCNMSFFFVSHRHVISIQVFRHGLLYVPLVQLVLNAPRLDLQHYVEKENIHLLETVLVKIVH